MQSRSRALTVAAALWVAPMLLLAACGGAAATGSTSNLTPIQGTSYVTIEPATTTTTTTTIAPPAGQEGPAPGTVSTVEQAYTIKAGDTLFKIATMHGQDIQTICTYNQWTDCETHLLLPGDIVRIPPDSLVPGTGGAATDAGTGTGTGDTGTGDTGTGDTSGDTSGDTGSTGSGCTYTIQAGDFPGTVASKFGITFDQLQAANPTRDFSTWFLTGASINIPPEGDCG